MKQRIIAILILAPFMFGSNVSKLYAKEKALKLQCEILVAASGGDYTSIQEAIDSLNPDPEIPCTISVAAGTYTENILITKSNIHLKGSGSVRTILQPVSNSNDPVITINDRNGVKIAGITIRDSFSVGVKSMNSSVTITESRFIYNYTAISLFDSDATITKTVFDNNKRGGMGTLSCINSNLLFSDNTIIDGEPVVIDSQYGNKSTATITRSTFFDVSPPIEIKHSDSSTRIIANEIFGEESDLGIRSYGSVVISENTIENYAQYAIYIVQGTAVIANNLLKGSEVGDGAAIVNSGISTITGNTIFNYPGDGVKNIRGVVTINGNTLKDIGRFGVSSTGLAVIMGNAFVNVNDGRQCIDSTTGAVAANLCNNSTLSVYGTITSPEDLTIQAAKNFNINTSGDMNVAADNVNFQSNKNMSLNADKNMNIDANEDMNMSAGSNISIKAEGNISSDAINNSITSSNDTNLNSRDTNINSSRDTTMNTVGTTEIKSGGSVLIKGSRFPVSP